MKRAFLMFGLSLFLFLGMSATTAAQDGTMQINYPSEGTFTIVDNAGVEDINRYINLLNLANLDQYRYENERRTLEFKSGVKFELKSMREVYPNDPSKKGQTVNPDVENPVFSIGKVGKADKLGVTFPVHEKSQARKKH